MTTLRSRRVSRASLFNSVLLLVAISAGFAFTKAVSSTESVAPVPRLQVVEDSTGASIAMRDYRRIVSTSTIADQVLNRLVEPDRVLAVSAHTLRTKTAAAYADKIGVEQAGDIETIIQLRPDIVFINNFVDRRHVERFKDAGLNVFDLGPMEGLRTLPTNIRQVAGVLGASARGEAIVERLLEELESVADDIPDDQRRGPALRWGPRHELPRRAGCRRIGRRGHRGRLHGVAGLYERAAPRPRPPLDRHEHRHGTTSLYAPWPRRATSLPPKPDPRDRDRPADRSGPRDGRCRPSDSGGGVRSEAIYSNSAAMSSA